VELDAFLADSAEAVQGKLYALGVGWNAIFVRVFPAVHSRVSVGIVIRVPYTATNQPHTVRMHLEREDGELYPLGESVLTASESEPTEVFEIGGQFNVGRPPLLPPGDEQMVCLALTVTDLHFDKPSRLTWVISIDGTEMKRLPMRVQQLVQPQVI
jgi:hypothetical protein